MQPRAPGTQASRRDLQCPGPARLRRVSAGSAHVPAQRHRVQQARSRATHRLAAQCTVRRGNTSPNLRYSSEIPEIQTPTAVYTSSAADFIVNTRAKPAPCCLASRAQMIDLSSDSPVSLHDSISPLLGGLLVLEYLRVATPRIYIRVFQHESMRWRVCSPGDGEGVVGHDRAARGILWRTSCSCSCIGTASLMHPARNSTPRSFTAVRYAAGCQRGTRLQPRGCPHHDPALRVECFCACRRATVQCVDAP